MGHNKYMLKLWRLFRLCSSTFDILCSMLCDPWCFIFRSISEVPFGLAIANSVLVVIQIQISHVALNSLTKKQIVNVMQNSESEFSHQINSTIFKNK